MVRELRRVLVTGASGAGTTTLGRALADALGAAFFDADDYFWLATDPPFREKRAASERLALLTGALASVERAVVAGAVAEWGRELEDSFSLIVFLTVPAAVRVDRLRARDVARYGRVDDAFLAWAAQYDEGRLAGRSRARQEAWLAGRATRILRLDGDLSTEQRLEAVLGVLGS